MPRGLIALNILGIFGFVTILQSVPQKRTGNYRLDMVISG
jgi:hypothetical protein